MSNITQFPRIIILLLLISFASFLCALFAPALPMIAEYYGISSSLAQWTMSIFLIGYTLGQLPYGPLSNRFGRKKALAMGAFIAFVGSLICYFSSEFWELCVGRFIQALGSSAGLKVAFTMVGDVHQGKAATRGVSLLTLAFGVMPGIAIAIGGYLVIYFGWQSCFLFLALYSALIWLLTLFLPETAKELDPDALQVRKIAHGLATQFKDSYVTLHAFLVGLSTAGIYIFTTLSPYIAIDRIGLAPNEFGLWSLLPALGLASGAFISVNLSRYNPRINMLSGILITLIGTIVLSVCFANDLVNVWSLFFPVYFIYIGINIIWSNSSSKGLSEATNKANASAVIQFINLSCATAGVFLIEVVPPTTTMLLPTAQAILIILMFATWIKLKAHHGK